MEFIIVLIWLGVVIFHLAYTNRRFDISYISDPVFVFLIGQTVMLVLLGVLNYTGYLRPAAEFSLSSTSYLVSIGLAFVIGSVVVDKQKYTPTVLEKRISTHVAQVIIKAAFVGCFILGSSGALLLLKSLYQGGLLGLLPYYVSHFGEFNAHFFNSSAALLWQANFATIFFGALLKRTRGKYVFLLIAFFNILLRSAFVYLVIAAFYYLTSMLILRKKKHFIYSVTIISLLLVGLAAVNYNLPSKSLRQALISVTPYTYGGFINYNINFSEFSEERGENYQAVQILAYLGFWSDMFYADKYLGTDFRPQDVAPLPFRNQLRDYVRYGNISTFYGNFIKVPYLLAVVFVFFLGILNRIVYRYAHSSVFALSIYSWFAAASFMSFAGSGYFASTRWVPAVMYIWPIVFILWLASWKRRPLETRGMS